MVWVYVCVREGVDRIFEVSDCSANLMLTERSPAFDLLISFSLTTFRYSYSMNVFMRHHHSPALWGSVCQSSPVPLERTLCLLNEWDWQWFWKSHLCLIIKTALLTFCPNETIPPVLLHCSQTSLSVSRVWLQICFRNWWRMLCSPLLKCNHTSENYM